MSRPAGLSNPAPIYVVGLFGMGYTDFYIFLIPLYGLSLGMNASEIGMLLNGLDAEWFRNTATDTLNLIST